MVANASPSGRQDSQGASSETGLILGTGFYSIYAYFRACPGWAGGTSWDPSSTPKIILWGGYFMGEEGR
jgi:hypothetical protein